MKILIATGLLVFSLGWAQTNRPDSLNTEKQTKPRFLPFNPGKVQPPTFKFYPREGKRKGFKKEYPSIARPQFLPFRPQYDKIPNLKVYSQPQRPVNKRDSVATKNEA